MITKVVDNSDIYGGGAVAGVRSHIDWAWYNRLDRGLDAMSACLIPDSETQKKEIGDLILNENYKKGDIWWVDPRSLPFMHILAR